MSRAESDGVRARISRGVGAVTANRAGKRTCRHRHRGGVEKTSVCTLLPFSRSSPLSTRTTSIYRYIPPSARTSFSRVYTFTSRVSLVPVIRHGQLLRGGEDGRGASKRGKAGKVTGELVCCVGRWRENWLVESNSKQPVRRIFYDRNPSLPGEKTPQDLYYTQR